MSLIFLQNFLGSKNIFSKCQNHPTLKIYECDDSIIEKIKSNYESIEKIIDIEGYTVCFGQKIERGRTEERCIFVNESRTHTISFLIDDNFIDYLYGYTTTENYTNGVLVEKIPQETDVTESVFSMNEEGDITLMITPKKSFMDKYDENHKILIEDFKNENYEGVKHHLAVAFVLINQIERNKKYRMSTPEKRDPELVKARAFLINDFKTYLKKLQSIQPEFDFASFYINNNYDKYIINIPIRTIQGIKSFIRKILLNF